MARLSEEQQRELANEHRGEVIENSATTIESRKLGQIVSVRLDSDTIVALREIANERRSTVSDLLREGADLIVESNRQSMKITQVTYQVTVTPPLTNNWETRTASRSGMLEKEEPISA